MTQRTRFSLALAAVLAAAGCVGAGGEPLATESEAPVVGNVGAIRGIVIDGSLVPISGANVSVHGITDVRRTNPEGQFFFPSVPVGGHAIVVEARGFASVSKAVDVAAQETTYTEIVLDRDISEKAYYVIQPWRGILYCGVTYRQGITSAIGYFLGASCNFLNSTGIDQSTFFTHLPDNVSIWRGGAAETEWTSTQAFGNGLVQDWAVQGCANNRNATFGRDFGPSPLRNLLGSFELDYRLQDIPNSSCNGDERCNERGCLMINRIFSWPSTMPDEFLADVGITMQQTFTTYITSFFRLEPPQSFTALADA